MKEDTLLSLLGCLSEDPSEEGRIFRLPEEVFIHDLSEESSITPEIIADSVKKTLIKNGVEGCRLDDIGKEEINALMERWMEQNAAYLPVLNSPPPFVEDQADGEWTVMFPAMMGLADSAGQRTARR